MRTPTLVALAGLIAVPVVAAAHDEAKTPISGSIILEMTRPATQSRERAFDESLKQEHRASELSFALAFRAHPLPMTIHDFPEGRYLDVNDAWLAQTGFTLDEEIDLDGTRAPLAFLTRKRFAAAYPLSPPGSA